jgi:hypothetical protein
MDTPFLIPSDAGGIFVAALEGHPDGFERFVGYFGGASEMKPFEARGLDRCSRVTLLPVSEILTPQASSHHSMMLWAHYETCEQIYKHGLTKVHSGFNTRECMFGVVCAQKKLCTQCGRGGHTAAGCYNKNSKADWANK